MGVKVHTIPIDPVTRQVNIKRVARAMYVFSRLVLAGHGLNTLPPSAILIR